MNETPLPSPAPRKWRRRFLWLLTFGLIVGLPFCAMFYYFANAPYWDRDAAIAETDALDPDWRIEGLEARRANVADAENSASLIDKLHAKLPKDLESHKPLDNVFYEFIPDRPACLLDEDDAVALAGLLDCLEPFRRECRKLANWPQGRFAIIYGPKVWDTVNPSTWNSPRPVASFLNYDVALLTHQGNYQTAWRSSRGILNTARAASDEPLPISQLVRCGLRCEATSAMERILAHGEVPDALLADTQAILADEASFPMSRVLLEGERACVPGLYKDLQTDPKARKMLLGGGKSKNWIEETRMQYFGGHDFVRVEAEALRWLNRAIAQTKEPEAEQARFWRKERREAENRGGWIGDQIRANCQMAEADLRTRAILRCTLAAIAAERYRLKHGVWPASLEKLVEARLLAEVPKDPFNGEPLRFRRTKDGLVIHSIGSEGDYAGDALDPLPAESMAVPLRFEFRLYDPASRRQPALPRKKVEDEPEID